MLWIEVMPSEAHSQAALHEILIDEAFGAVARTGFRR
jgi:hypothetical protein